ncbi:Response regulator receiver domain-containing protein [endosymbiont of Ridgeia piscesae]|jgi:CheY-like chemotaxis protein|uniref:Response regulator receiver domain-containing protein n=2 Tax=endosymbiont of Ridgeia piscesae TaxID=54398 RepID=A0A0T5YZB2_9GAMM|nr:Response regulator receiver domain-containing protein [endosymbiont of Ridgeia piscesae]
MIETVKADAPNLKLRGTALVADDELSNRVILNALLKKLGYQVIQAVDGADAVEKFRQHSIDIVLMDVMMPVMDGYAATEIIKSETADKFIPVLFLTAMTDDKALARCIEVGGDDFLTKPYNHTVLSAKIQSMERIQNLHQDIRMLYNRMQMDEEIAEQVFSGAVLAGNVVLDQISHLHKPASIFSGDIMLTAYSPSHDLHVLLGDFTGHGLAAALGALPTSEVFRSMTAKGFSPPQILQGINSKLHKMLPTGMFLAAQFVKISASLDYITVFNCGMPDLFVIDGNTRRIKNRLESRSMPLGIIPDSNFQEDAQHIRVGLSDRVLLTTDGVSEARDPTGEYFGSERLITAIEQSGEQAFILDNVSSALDRFCSDAPQDDDITMVELPLLPELLPSWRVDQLLAEQTHVDPNSLLDHDSDSVEFHITLRGMQLRKADPVPLLINYIQEMVGIRTHNQVLFTILTELFINALDHGVLGLDSSLKEGPDGFTRYFEERDRMLSQLNEGSVHIGLRIHPQANGGWIVIQIEDSGPGFDFANATSAQGEKPLFSGRGIQLLSSLCESFSYLEPGNRAEAIYAWTNE